MAINFGAFLPAAARGVGAYMQGQRIGEDQQKAEALAQHKMMFDEWARSQQLRQQDEQRKAQLAATSAYQQEMLGRYNDDRQSRDDIAANKTNASTELEKLRQEFKGRMDDQTRQMMQARIAYLEAMANKADRAPVAGQGDPMKTAKAQAALAKQFSGDHAVVDANLTADKVAQAHALANGHGPLNDLGLIEAAIQIYNPRAIVRQGTLKTFKDETKTVPQELESAWRRASGNPNFILADAQKKNLLATIDQVGKQKYEGFKPTLAQYGGLSRDMGVDSAKVAIDRFAPIYGAGAQAPAAPGGINIFTQKKPGMP